MGSWYCDDSQWPLFRQGVVGDIENQQVDEMFADAERKMEGRGHYVLIGDATHVGHVSAYMRKRTIAWQKLHRGEIERDCLGIAWVLASPLMRYIAMTILLVSPMPAPYKVVQTEAEAIEWARAKLEQWRSSGGPSAHSS